MTNREEIISKVRSVADNILPSDVLLVLFGSRARGEATQESDWDFLMLLDKPLVEPDDFKQYAYPLVRLGWDLGEYFSIKLYTHNEWQQRKGTPFYKNVEQDRIMI